MTEMKRRLVVLDMDRTIIDSNVAADLYGESLAKVIHTDFKKELQLAKDKTEDRGGSFGARSFLKTELQIPQRDLESIDTHFLELCFDPVNRDKLVYADAALFSRKLGALAVPRMILTQGDDPEWQLLKLKASRFDSLPYCIAGLTDKDGAPLSKGQIIASWYDAANGLYIPDTVVPDIASSTLAAPVVDLFDDKASSFVGLPPECAGGVVRRGEPRPSQIGQTRGNIIELKTFHDIQPEIRYRAA